MGDNGYSYFCTGFLIGTDVLMTNQHCMQSDAEVNSTEVDFDYDDKDAKRVTMTLLKREFVDASLDVAIYRIAGQTGREKLHLADLVPDDGRALLIIQHPGGEPKQISEEECVVQGVSLRGVSDNLTDFGHRCDTLGGSSGSPVFDLKTGQVIGLHHLGFLLDSKMLVNQAVRMGLIISAIRGKNPSLLD
jgi:hypothetical protein